MIGNEGEGIPDPLLQIVDQGINSILKGLVRYLNNEQYGRYQLLIIFVDIYNIYFNF